MNLKLRPVEDLEEAFGLLPLLTRGAQETAGSYLEADVDEEATRRFLERIHGRDSALVLVAEAEGQTGAQAVAVTAPFVDPLTGAELPMLVVLYVDPSLRHRGLARALVKEVRRILGQRGLDVLVARAGHTDDAIVSMGERWGLVRTWEVMSTE